MAEPTSTSSSNPAAAIESAPPATTPPHTAEQAVDRAQKSATNLNAAVEGSPSAALTDLKAVDTALAAELDSLLDGEFETIDAVLHGRHNAPRAVNATSQHVGTTVNATATTTPHAESASSATAANQQAGASSEVAAPSTSSDVRSNQIESAPLAPAPTSPATAPSPAVSAGSAPQSKHESRRTSDSTGDKSVELKPRSRMTSFQQPVINALMLINSPLRLIPAGLKPAVDWVALSLLVWVPIVWVLVFVIGAGGKTAHAGSPDSAAQSLHGESTNNAKGAHEAGGHESSEGGHDSKKSTSAGGHDSGHSSAKAKDKAKPPPTKAAGNKLPKEKSASSKKSKTADAGAHH